MRGDFRFFQYIDPGAALVVIFLSVGSAVSEREAHVAMTHVAELLGKLVDVAPHEVQRL